MVGRCRAPPPPLDVAKIDEAEADYVREIQAPNRKGVPLPAREFPAKSSGVARAPLGSAATAERVQRAHVEPRVEQLAQVDAPAPGRPPVRLSARPDAPPAPPIAKRNDLLAQAVRNTAALKIED